MSFCGCRAQFGDGTPTYKLSNQRPTFYVKDAPPGFTRDQWIGFCMEAFGRWSAVCDVVWTPTNDSNAAQFLIFTHQFDGPSGILADCEFPMPGGGQQQMRIDPSERWTTQIDPLRVLCHEMGHGIGLQHFDPNVPPPELMNPIYSQTIDHPQSGEVSYVQKLYGLPQTVTPTTPPAIPTIGDSAGVDVIINVLKAIPAGTKLRATGKMHVEK